MTGEFEQLLDYLESNNKKLFKKSEYKKSEGKQVAQKEVKLENYKEIHSDVQPVKKSVVYTSSNGFNVEKFYNLCNSRLTQEYISGQNYERPYFSVTELLQCVRMTYFQRMKYPIDINHIFKYGPLLLIQEVGKEIHLITQSIYGFEESEKVVIDKNFNVKGRVDALIKNFLFEIKTIDEEKYNGNYIDKHFIQGCIYSYILNNNYDYNIDTITIVYFSRTLKNIYSFDVKYDENIAKKYLKYALILKQSIETKKIPNKIESDIEQCKFCNYKKYCNEEIKIKNPSKDDTLFLL